MKDFNLGQTVNSANYLLVHVSYNLESWWWVNGQVFMKSLTLSPFGPRGPNGPDSPFWPFCPGSPSMPG